MLSFIKNIILTVIGFVFLVIIVVVLTTFNIGIFVFSGGKSYGNYKGEYCKEYLFNNFNIDLVSEDTEITCHIEDLFPPFLAQFSFIYEGNDNYIIEIGKMGLSEAECENGNNSNGICYKGIYKNSSHYIEIEEKGLKVIKHRINF